MQKTDWHGVIPAITTPFTLDGQVDLAFLKKHVAWQIEAGCRGVVALGSLGEGATLRYDEKLAILEACVEVCGDLPVVAGISALSTQEAVDLSLDAEQLGVQGLMVLPPYVYPGDRKEITAHFDAVIEATGLSCMLYNNPIAYGIDLKPDWIAEFAAKHENLHAVKESSADIRRLHEIRRLIGDRLALFVGVDDIIVEGIQSGATGWIAGLVNAFPHESVALFNLAMEGRYDEATKIYHWFLPLLRLDVVPKFVQLIKLAQVEVGMGSPTVRLPRLELEGADLAEVQKLIRDSVANRPKL